MSNLTIISVDSPNGNITDGDLSEQERYAEEIEAQYGVTLHGPPGFDARMPNEGGPGGYLSVELSESAEIAEGVQVDVLHNGSLHELPPVWQIPSGGIVRFTARGGDGETGRDGGNGSHGRPGPDGVAATRDVDATDGANGGDGGSAGTGTSGADGGKGGSIDILVDENMSHLLIAAEWDTRGGPGGTPGHHGKPGKGGIGGKGGDAYEWEEFLGYRYKCTANCRGLNPEGPRAVMQGRLPSGNQVLDLVRPIRQQVVIGSNLNRVIIAAAQRHRDLTRLQQAGAGHCRCAGGTGSCVGCQRITVNTPLKRGKGRDGLPGHPGTPPPQTLLGPGIRGHDGEGRIIVQRADGTQSTYSSRYRLELIGFEVTDENQDGIFEPGEHIVIQHVRVRNTGGMPSPTRPIQLTVVGSEWIESLESDEGRLYISKPIPIGESVTLEGSIKAKIRPLDRPTKRGKALLETHTISLRAVMPWLNRELPLFSFKKKIDIQYPLEISGFNILSNLAPGSKNKLTIKLLNKSSKAYGRTSELRRPISVSLSFPVDSGNLVSEGVNWNNFEAEKVLYSASKSNLDIHQSVGVSATAEHNALATIRINLFTSYAEEGLNDEFVLPLQLIHQVDFTVKISSAYEYHNDAAFCVVTNSDAPNDTVQAIRHFVENGLRLRMDVWNIGLYGGLQGPLEETETAARTVLSSYSGKSVIFLGNQFSYFGNGSRNALQLCDILPLAQACNRGTSCLFHGYSDARSYAQLKKFIFPVCRRLSESADAAREGTHFSSKQRLLESICQSIRDGASEFTTYTMTVRSGVLSDSQGHTRREAESVAKYFREHLPQERFLVSSLYPAPNNLLELNQKTNSRKIRKQQDCGLVVVFRGLSQDKSIRMAHSYPMHHIQHVEESTDEYNSIGSLGQIRTSPTTKPRLDPFDAYLCVASLPPSRRIDVICSMDDSVEDGENISPFVLQAAELSLIEELNGEVWTLLERGSLLNSLNLIKEPDLTLRLHFPQLATLIQNPKVLAVNPLPRRILKVFRYLLASSFPEKKRHRVKNHLFPFGGQHAEVQQFLMTTIIGFFKTKNLSEKAVQEFYVEASSIESPVDGKKRHVSRIIRQEIAALTKKSEHEYAGSCKTTKDVVSETMYCEEAEWDTIAQNVQEAQQKIANDIALARNVLQQMTDV